MLTLPAQRLVRLAFLPALATLAMNSLLKPHSPLPPEVPEGFVAAMKVTSCVGFMVFGWLFWRATSESAGSSRRRRIALLIVQLLLVPLLSTELLYLIAAELPLVIPPRVAVRWLGGALLLTVALAIAGLLAKDFEASPELAHLPLALAAPLTLLTVMAWEVFAFGVGYLASIEGRQRRELESVNRELRATQELLSDSSRLAERLNIARDLHDTLGHHLTALSVHLELARKLCDGKASAVLAQGHAVAKLLLADVRDTVGALRRDRVIDLRRALTTLCSSSGEPAVVLTYPENLELTDAAAANALFRCAQEAITNAVRHGQAHTLRLELASSAGGVTLVARDDGRGVAEIRSGHGLTGMRERIEELKGWLKLDSAPGHGFTIEAFVPTRPIE